MVLVVVVVVVVRLHTGVRGAEKASGHGCKGTDRYTGWYRLLPLCSVLLMYLIESSFMCQGGRDGGMDGWPDGRRLKRHGIQSLEPYSVQAELAQRHGNGAIPGLRN